MPFRWEDLILRDHTNTIGDGSLALHCLENRWVAELPNRSCQSSSFNRVGRIDFNKRNEYKYCEWRKGDSRNAIIFD